MILKEAHMTKWDTDRQQTPAIICEGIYKQMRKSKSAQASRSQEQFSGNTKDRQSCHVTVISRTQHGANSVKQMTQFIHQKSKDGQERGEMERKPTNHEPCQSTLNYVIWIAIQSIKKY